MRTVAAAVADADAAIDAVAPQDALAAVWRIVEALNGYLTEQAPWKVAKDDGRSGERARPRSSTPPPRGCGRSRCCSTR